MHTQRLVNVAKVFANVYFVCYAVGIRESTHILCFWCCAHQMLQGLSIDLSRCVDQFGLTQLSQWKEPSEQLVLAQRGPLV
ncbi:unnamed protein product [Vitrella brassicaformis CCMP3155]|uniref:Uncharacterized protein n=1 Tax=Vitrella brassicaformis (strain CCMP3155) TaxID=1169540 RepID=A0A0G4FE15_VITBC|nr:unnamed protein product [Vitrella brassicaformis CCMP3155]|eukprot:CEM11449.1 unnamed protein product [Vitrella brassicaformis CCMP3155]